MYISASSTSIFCYFPLTHLIALFQTYRRCQPRPGLLSRSCRTAWWHLCVNAQSIFLSAILSSSSRSYQTTVPPLIYPAGAVPQMYYPQGPYMQPVIWVGDDSQPVWFLAS